MTRQVVVAFLVLLIVELARVLVGGKLEIQLR